MPAHPKSPLLSLSPDDRVRQVAAILARGALRINSARVVAIDASTGHLVESAYRSQPSGLFSPRFTLSPKHHAGIFEHGCVLTI